MRFHTTRETLKNMHEYWCGLVYYLLESDILHRLSFHWIFFGPLQGPYCWGVHVCTCTAYTLIQHLHSLLPSLNHKEYFPETHKECLQTYTAAMPHPDAPNPQHIAHL